MTHFSCLVIGENIEGQMARYDENRAVEPYREYLDDDDIARMAEHFKHDPSDLAGLVQHMAAWHGRAGGLDERGLYYITTYNPDSKWDWYVVGGRQLDGDPDGYFRLRDGSSADITTIGQVDWPRFFGDGARPDPSGFTDEPWWSAQEQADHAVGIRHPVAIVAEGAWHGLQVGWFGYVNNDGQDRHEDIIRALITALLEKSPDTPITKLDCHI